MANASQVASAGVYVTDDIGLEVTDGSNSRVQLGLLPTGTYGLRVVTAGGTTVIIDGTSDMFKIAATGTTSVTAAAWTTGAPQFGQTTVSLPGAGSFTATPAFLDFHSTTNDATSYKLAGVALDAGSTVYAASASAGSPTTAELRLDYSVWGATILSGGTVSYVVSANNVLGSSETAYRRYYILLEAAM